MKKHINSNR